jgi:hypothetical protein
MKKILTSILLLTSFFTFGQGSHGLKVIGSSGSVGGDTTSLSNRINQKADLLKVVNDSTILSNADYTLYKKTDTSSNSFPNLGAGYYSINTTGSPLNLQDGFVINLLNQTKIRQTGKITKIQFYLNIKPASTLVFTVWRKTGSTYNLIASSNILSASSEGIVNTITLAAPLSVQEGDYTGFNYTNTTSQQCRTQVKYL